MLDFYLFLEGGLHEKTEEELKIIHDAVNEGLKKIKLNPAKVMV